MKWNESDRNVREYLRKVREDQRLFDVTLATDDGQHIQAHRIILAAGSQFFSDIFLKSNHANMMIYLKGIHSVQVEHLLDFLYNGEVSVGQEEIKMFLEIGKELQVKGFENYVPGVGESSEEGPARYANLDEEIHENGDNIIEEDIISETLLENNFCSDGAFGEKDVGKFQLNANSDLDLQITQMIEKSEGVWCCKVCGKTTINSGHIREHAETHIEGMSHVCCICDKTFPNRPALRYHKRSKIHKKLSNKV